MMIREFIIFSQLPVFITLPVKHCANGKAVMYAVKHEVTDHKVRSVCF